MLEVYWLKYPLDKNCSYCGQGIFYCEERILFALRHYCSFYCLWKGTSPEFLNKGGIIAVQMSAAVAEVKEAAKEVKAYCLKCKKAILVSNPLQTETKNKRQRVSGECPDCSKKVSQFLKSEKPAAAAAEPEKAVASV